ncbi:MAG: glycosyltransferase [Bacteroidetes bacterium]|nr:glycosyltransferase [Bacteroidota bacterium]
MKSEILFMTSYPPRECGIATYSQDLIKALNNKFRSSFSIKVCALESGKMNLEYPETVKYKLDTTFAPGYHKLARSINHNKLIKLVVIQHEFGFFHQKESAFLQFIYEVAVPVIVVFHTVLPRPDERLKANVQNIADACASIVVMTNSAAEVLKHDFDVPEQKISVIAHGTHLVSHLEKESLKEKYGLSGKRILSTFGLISSGKDIETTLKALPAIVKTNPDVMFLLIGKTHPEVVKSEGEKYRNMLETTVIDSGLQDHVKFINRFLALPELLEYLQLTDIYLFTANDPNQAVSGTFVYAMSCACPIISTPIPHAKELLSDETGLFFDFHNAQQLTDGVIRLLNDEPLRKNISVNALQKIGSTSWENSAVAHAMLFEKQAGDNIAIRYNLPEINLDHIKKMTTGFGIIQFSIINQPEIDSGYTLDDNARALIAMCMHYELSADKTDLAYIQMYLDFIEHCLQPAGDFLNYVDDNKQFTAQNGETNLDDSNGRAIWALGYVVSLMGKLPEEFISQASILIDNSMRYLGTVHSTRAMAFSIKGLYFNYETFSNPESIVLLTTFADRLVQMYKHESSENWEWFESYLTYANSTLPEAMLYAWIVTGETIYKEIALSSLNFLLSHIYKKNGIEVISNKNWLLRGHDAGQYGEQPIDVAYTIMTLSKFFEVFHDEVYSQKMVIAFNWFLGNNRLHQIIYNPCTGGCYDGLEENYVNINQGAESTVSYLMARLTMEKRIASVDKPKIQFQNQIGLMQ